MNRHTSLPEIPEYPVGLSTCNTMSQIDVCIRDCIARVHKLTLSELHSERDILMKYDELISIEPEILISNPSIAIHQGVVKVALLHARKEILRCIDARLRFLQQKSGYPTFESVFSRHEDTDYTPGYHPDWTEKEWKSLWHKYRKALRDLAHEERMRPLKQERQEEEERIQKDNVISRLLGRILEQRDRVIERNASQKRQLQLIATRATSNDLRENALIIEGFYSFAGAFSDEELYFTLDYNLQRSKGEKSKVNRRFYATVIGILKDELHMRNLPHDNRATIQAGHSRMTPGERDRFISTTL